MATITVSSTSQLLSALSSAKGGDTILLSPGSYGGVKFNNLSYDSMVTIKSADSDNPAVFSGVGIDNTSHLRIDDVKVASPSNGSSTSKLVSITDSNHVEFLNSEVHGKIDNTYDGHYGIYTKDSNDLVLSGNYVHDVKIGFVINGADRLTVSENYVNDTGSDGLKFIGVHNFLIENNTHGGTFHPQPGAHLDFMQFQGSSPASGSSDGVIRGNVFLAESHANVQGIFLADTTYDNILIEQNIISTGMLNAIKVGTYGTNITTINNTVVNIPDTVHKASKVGGGDISYGNFFASYKQEVGSNFQSDTDDYAQFFKGDIKLGMTLEDLRPVEGSASEQYGANERLSELLDGSSDVTEPSSPQPIPPEDSPAEPLPSNPELTEPDDSDQTNADQLDGAAFSMLKTQSISGSSDVIEVAHDSELSLETGTIALSFNADSVSGRKGLLSKDASYYAGGGNHLAAYIENGTLVVRFQDGSGDEIARIKGIKANQDYDLQIAFGDNEVAVWLDGQQVHSADFSMNLAENVEYLQIGALGWGSETGEAGYNTVFDGEISNVAIVEGKWTPVQMQQLMKGSEVRLEEPVTEPEEPATEPEAPVAEPEAPVAEPEAPVAELEEAVTPADTGAKTVFEVGEIEFTGKKNSIANLDHDQALELEEGTIAFTVNADDLWSTQGLLSKDASGYDGGDHLSIYLKGAELILRFQDAETGEDAYLAYQNFDADKDYDVRTWFGNGEIGLAVNGELVATEDFDFELSGNQQNLQLGGLGWASSNGGGEVTKAFNGTMSDVTIWDQSMPIETFDLLM
ncbi:LamG domain-containing protein [Ruegeria sp. AU67]|uniref:LamG domain-containing protein n=1 Tax=Ruegeria sp. AU67 TaxID=2108530 RepID=UPI000D68DA50|nr:LamG domain-containing protein [Ruegeria sp. AU67]